MFISTLLNLLLVLHVIIGQFPLPKRVQLVKRRHYIIKCCGHESCSINDQLNYYDNFTLKTSTSKKPIVIASTKTISTTTKTVSTSISTKKPVTTTFTSSSSSISTSSTSSSTTTVPSISTISTATSTSTSSSSTTTSATETSTTTATTITTSISTTISTTTTTETSTSSTTTSTSTTTTTTTLLPTTPTINCSIDCATDKSLLDIDANNRIQVLTDTLPQSSYFITLCDKVYYFILNYPNTFFDLYDFCCSIGFQLAEFQNLADFTCLSNYSRDDMYGSYNLIMGATNGKTYCSDESFFQRSLFDWKLNDPQHGPYYTLNFTEGFPLVMQSSDQSIFPSVLCSREISCVPNCLSKPCVANNSDELLFDAAGDLRDVSIKYPNAGNITVCNKLYVFQSDLMTWDQSFEFCCGLGMYLVSFLNFTQLNCVAEAIFGHTSQINDVFWTSGSQKECQFNAFWCTLGVEIPVKRIIFGPAAEQLNHVFGSDCLAVRNLGNFSAYLEYRDCSLPTKIICEDQ